MGREGASRAEDWAASAGRGEKAGTRWAVREGKKGETAWAVRGLGLGRFGLKGWFLGWVWFLLLVFLSFSLFLILIQTQAKRIQINLNSNSNQTTREKMLQHECNNHFNPMINFNYLRIKIRLNASLNTINLRNLIKAN